MDVKIANSILSEVVCETLFFDVFKELSSNIMSTTLHQKIADNDVVRNGYTSIGALNIANDLDIHHKQPA